MNSVHQIKDANGVSTWASIPPFYRPDIEWPWVIYDHGYGQLGSHIYSDSNLGDLVKSLASAGYIVIASDYRNINCWGNADCDDDIANLQDVWRAHLRL